MQDHDHIGSHNPMPKLSRRYLKWTAYGLILLTALLFQSSPVSFRKSAGAAGSAASPCGSHLHV